MSQHIFETTHQNRPVRVVMGWDRPLQGYFMLVERLDIKRDARNANEDDPSDCDGDELLFDNLADVNPWPRSVDYYRDKLAQLGIAVPGRMIAAVEQDARDNVGNRMAYYNDEAS